MSRQLFILRHAKSDWGSGARTDSERPLNKRGHKDAPRIGVWLREHNLSPAWVLCSPALRARQTLTAVAEELHLPAERIEYVDKLYLADRLTLLNILGTIPKERQSVMLVGHNPGLDELVSYLSRTPVPLTDSGKLMTTACLAQFSLPDDWQDLESQGELVNLIRPTELD